MTPLEIIATIFAILILVKISIVMMNPKLWLKIAEPVMRNYTLTAVVYAIVAVIVGYYIFASLNIVQVAAVMLFTAILIGLGLLPFHKHFMKIGQEMSESRSVMFQKVWLQIVIWVAMAVWVLYAVLASAGVLCVRCSSG
ncbi:MAG: hypothetical protein V3U14_12540 [candidate division NC10 bacterium]